MSWIRDRLALGALERVRLATTIFAMMNAVIMLPLQAPHLSGTLRALGFGASIAIVVDVLLTYARGRTFWAEPLLAGPLVFACGLYVGSASGLIGFAIAAATAQTLYGPVRPVLIRSGGVLVAITVLVLIPNDVFGQASVIQGTPPPILILVPAFFPGFVRLVGSALMLLDQAGKREALLADVGVRLSGLTDRSEVLAVLRRAARDLCELTPGLSLLAVRSSGGEAVIESAYAVAGEPVGRKVPLNWLEQVDPNEMRVVHHLPDATFASLVGRRRSGWSAFGVGSQDTSRYVLLGSSARTIPAGVVDTLRTLGTQRSLAEANCNAHAELTHLAHRDQLTTTPNRRAFLALVAEAMETAQRPGAGELALLIVDLDDFKQVNDTLGHQAGDELLIEIAGRLRSVAGERGVASRFGGDEFAILLTGLAGQADADAVAEQVLLRLQEPVQLTGGVVAVGGSVGLVGGASQVTVEDLMRCADIAMYSAKARGKNRVERFSEERHGEVAQHRLLEEHFPGLIARDELVLHYQPQFDLKTGRVMGVEALARWQHPSFGLLLPEEFMQVAERHGHVGALCAHILRVACRQLAQWTAQEAQRELRICVNVSSRLLLTPGFDAVVREVLEQTAVPAGQLSLEFSESEVLEQDLPQRQLAAIGAMGVRIALDDFGAGNISLANLRSLRLSQLKIDCRLFGQMDGGAATDTILLIMAVSRFLRLETVAKKIENQGQLDWARHEGLTLGQGYHLGSPVPVEAFDHWLDGDTRLAEHAGEPAPEPSGLWQPGPR